MKNVFLVFSYDYNKSCGNYVKDVEDSFEISSRADIRRIEVEISEMTDIEDVIITNIIILPIK